ncbi:MAG: polyprenyl synthetase family protein, partial [Flavobacteriaceae bacterium]
MMVEVGSLPSLGVLSQAASIIAEGEVMQLTTAQNMATTEDDYLQVIRAKTAALFSAACEVGPILAGDDGGARSALKSFGTNLGLAFQLVDDALDYSGAQKKLGKRVGDDLREGKVTLPVLLAYRRGDARERGFWKRTLVDREVADDDLETAISIMKRHRAIDDTIQRARHYAAIAADALAIFPDGEHRAALLDAIAFCVRRVH